MSILKYILLITLLSQCASYEKFRYLTEDYEVPAKVFKSNYDQTWLAILQVVKKYDLQLQDQDSGVIKTKWTDNTLQLNFSDSFGSSDSIKAAKFKLIINIVKGFRGKREVSKVTIYKRQMVEQDFLQGSKVVPSDGILEKTILYRIGRSLSITDKLQKIEDQKAKEVEENF
jgi:hypothetical protein